MRIGIAFDLVPVHDPADGPDDRYEEFDKPATIEAIAQVLRHDGHDVELLGDGRALVERLLADPPDFVWNIAEGEGVGRSREARVPALLELLAIPYSGSDPLALAASLDKEMARRLASSVAVPVAKGLTLAPEWPEAKARCALAAAFDATADYPLILKPAFEGSSKGIRGPALADNLEEALELFQNLVRGYQQPVLAEQFIEGDEITVGLLGNGPARRTLGIMRIVPRCGPARFVYSVDIKRDWRKQVAYEAPAELRADILDQVVQAAHEVYRVLGCRDVARIDFRIKNGVAYFLEANPLPGLNPESSDLVILARSHGISYDDLIRGILSAALTRVGLAHPELVAP